MHNMSIVSHLSVDPAALAQASMLQGHNPHMLDMSQFGVGPPQANDDRQQIIQWHINQIA